jgi:hypothetical protein
MRSSYAKAVLREESGEENVSKTDNNLLSS